MTEFDFLRCKGRSFFFFFFSCYTTNNICLIQKYNKLIIDINAVLILKRGFLCKKRPQRIQRSMKEQFGAVGYESEEEHLRRSTSSKPFGGCVVFHRPTSPAHFFEKDHINKLQEA